MGISGGRVGRKLCCMNIHISWEATSGRLALGAYLCACTLQLAEGSSGGSLVMVHFNQKMRSNSQI